MDNSLDNEASLTEKINRLEEALAVAENHDALKGHLLKNVAHDLSSSFHAMPGLVRILKKSAAGSNLSEKQLTIINTLDKAMSGYQRTLENIAELSRILRDKVEISPQRFSLKPLSARALEMISEMADEKGISVTIIQDEEMEVMADETKALQTLERVLENAVIFTNPGGHVSIGWKRNEDKVSLEVKDDGVGIDEKRLPRIFGLEEKDFTFGTQDEKGSGMGLCIALMITELNGGDLEIESSPGKGCLVRISLPAS